MRMYYFFKGEDGVQGYVTGGEFIDMSQRRISNEKELNE